jgi:FixJ family two-component response regulator
MSFAMDNVVLALDDEPALLKIIQKVAKSADFAVTVTTDPAIFQAALFTQPPSVVLLDLQAGDRRATGAGDRQAELDWGQARQPRGRRTSASRRVGRLLFSPREPTFAIGEDRRSNAARFGRQRRPVLPDIVEKVAARKIAADLSNNDSKPQHH